MKFIITPRATGRTYQLIKFLKNSPKRAMIVATCNMKARLQYTHKDVANQIFTYDEYKYGGINGRGFEIIDIDDVDLILQQMFYEPIGYATMPTDVLVGSIVKDEESK
jgi:hypothetical protein